MVSNDNGNLSSIAVVESISPTSIAAQCRSIRDNLDIIKVKLGCKLVDAIHHF